MNLRRRGLLQQGLLVSYLINSDVFEDLVYSVLQAGHKAEPNFGHDFYLPFINIYLSCKPLSTIHFVFIFCVKNVFYIWVKMWCIFTRFTKRKHYNMSYQRLFHNGSISYHQQEAPRSQETIILYTTLVNSISYCSNSMG